MNACEARGGYEKRGEGGGGGCCPFSARYVWEVIAAKIHAPYSMIGGGGGVVKCCRLLHKTSTIIPYQPLFLTIGYYYS